MKLKDCDTDIDVVAIRPPFRNAPDPSWCEAQAKKAIPGNLYIFYGKADCFSIEKSPPFLRDEKRILFSHLETSLELIKTSFVEYFELLENMREYDSNAHSDKTADIKFKRSFQSLVINMYSILDAVAASMGVVLSCNNFIRISFSEIVSMARKSAPKKVLSLNGVFKENILDVIRQDNDWFDLFQLYRNKLAHFRYLIQFCYRAKDSEKFYVFLPKQWPCYIQQHIKFGNTVSNEQKAEEKIEDMLMHIDIFEYCEMVREKIFSLTDKIFQVLIEAYKIKKELPTDAVLVEQIKDVPKTYSIGNSA